MCMVTGRPLMYGVSHCTLTDFMGEYTSICASKRGIRSIPDSYISVKVGYWKSTVQNGRPSEAPTTDVGIPTSSRIADRSCEPLAAGQPSKTREEMREIPYSPPRTRQVCFSFWSCKCSGTSHSENACFSMDSARSSLSLIEAGE
jgi:hypothetical protein